MGSFGGHAVPGTFFFCFGFWFVLSALRKKITWRGNKEQLAHTVEALPPQGCCAKLRNSAVEGYLKVICCFIGILIEGPAGIYFRDGARYQHTTMYTCFGFSGVVDLLVHYQVAPEQITPRLATLAFALSFVVEGILFNFHLHGREFIDVKVHMLLVYVCFACAASCLIEIRHPGSTFGRLLRGFFTMVHGSWFWQAGAILYPLVGKRMDLKNPHNVMIVALIFSWHLVVTLTVVTILAVVVNGRCCCRKQFGSVENGIPLNGGYSMTPQIDEANDPDQSEKQLLLCDEDGEIEL